MNPSTSRRPPGNWNLLLDRLRRLAALHPECGHNGKTLRLVAEEWAALLKREEATTREFLDALDVIARHCKFFPTPADLYEALREVREHPPRIPERFRLTEPPQNPKRHPPAHHRLAGQGAERGPRLAARQQPAAVPATHDRPPALHARARRGDFSRTRRGTPP